LECVLEDKMLEVLIEKKRILEVVEKRKKEGRGFDLRKIEGSVNLI
jgi:hypothetical protein